MLLRKTFLAGKGKVQTWTVPTNLLNGTAFFECWGAPGGMGGQFAFRPRTTGTDGANGLPCKKFHNRPGDETALGVNYSNNAGYAYGKLTGLTPGGETFQVQVGVAGRPGNSTITTSKSGNVTSHVAGGSGGWPDGGDGGDGALTYQNLYNAANDKVKFKSKTIPNVANSGELWLDTTNWLVKKCNSSYTSGASNKASKWTTVTQSHGHSTGGGGGGGGGSTSIVRTINGVDTRILIAGGAGGASSIWSKTGSGRWLLRACPSNPRPPFGLDSTASGATGILAVSTGTARFYDSSINTLAGGWGLGGIGGASGPNPGAQPTADGGYATTGGSGGPATARHADGKTPGSAHGTGGGGGTNLVGGRSGGMGATAGAGNAIGGSGNNTYLTGQGGKGATAKGGTDDFTIGGGGGGGGYFGGGGGGAGFRGPGTEWTKGGGGGGGSNYASSAFSQVLLCGGARPPYIDKPTIRVKAPDGLGGFARITWHAAPVVSWVETALPSGVLFNSSFNLSFTYAPAEVGGVGIDHYNIGTNTNALATSPTTTTTIMVNDATQTSFTQAFTAPTSGATWGYYVQVVDKDGDASPWISTAVTGMTAAQISPSTITSPASGATFIQTATVNWTIGNQTPLVAYRLSVSGNDLTTGAAQFQMPSGWHRGGSRVNLATDPGFTTSTVWSSTANASLVGGDTSFPGVSTKNGKTSWTLTNNYDAENHTAKLNNLTPNEHYRLHIEVASNRANDPRPYNIQIWDGDGQLDGGGVYDNSAQAAGAYNAIDLTFSPRTQGVYIVLVPAATGYGTQYVDLDFEDATTDGFGSPAVSDTAHANSGNTAIKNSAASSFTASTFLLNRTVTVTTTGTDNTLLATSGSFVQTDVGLPVSGTNIPANATITSFTDATHVTISANTTAAGTGITATVSPLAVAGEYLLDVWGFAPTASTTALAPTVTGTGVSNAVVATSTVKNSWVNFRVPFKWDGAGVVTVTLSGEATNFHWWDDVQIWSADNTNPQTGNTDSNQITYLANMLLELSTVEDATAGYRTYFDGTHLNGNTGTLAQVGTVGAAGSYASLAGTDVVTGTATYTGSALKNGQINLDTISVAAEGVGSAYIRATQPVNVNPSVPATPTVTLTVDSTTGIQTLAINAVDGALSNKTTSFDIFRGSTRIVTGLTPDATTRAATYMDAPGHAVTAVYTVRAWDSAGGYADQTTGTVTLVS